MVTSKVSYPRPNFVAQSLEANRVPVAFAFQNQNLSLLVVVVGVVYFKTLISSLKTIDDNV